jgi:NADH:ubiquinone oxidoreductase subunit F (NADH-binding)
LSGAVDAPGVYEIAQGTPLTEVLELGGAESRLAGILIGGYFGAWVTGAEASRLLLSRAE